MAKKSVLPKGFPKDVQGCPHPLCDASNENPQLIGTETIRGKSYAISHPLCDASNENPQLIGTENIRGKSYAIYFCAVCERTSLYEIPKNKN